MVLLYVLKLVTTVIYIYTHHSNSKAIPIITIVFFEDIIITSKLDKNI